MCMYMYIYICTSLSLSVYICICIYISPYMHVNTDLHTYIHTYKHTNIQAYKHTYIHTYVHTHTHTERQRDRERERGGGGVYIHTSNGDLSGAAVICWLRAKGLVEALQIHNPLLRLAAVTIVTVLIIISVLNYDFLYAFC